MDNFIRERRGEEGKGRRGEKREGRKEGQIEGKQEEPGQQSAT